MEKQRIKRLFKSGRRFLVTLSIFFCTSFAFSQNLTVSQIKQLRIVPEEGQNLYTKTDIKFVVTIPNARPSQVQVLSANQPQEITFRSMRKVENYEYNGTTLEMWFNFSTSGTYTLNSLSMMIQNRRAPLYFEPVTITDDPATMTPRIVLVFDDGTEVYSDDLEIPNPLLKVPTGKKLGFTVNIQYATQLVQFNWEIPKDSIFTCTKQYEFTEVRYRERVYSHSLIPVASFEWTGLISGPHSVPRVKMNAAGYNGYRSELILPQIIIEFVENEEAETLENNSDIFEAAFYQEEKVTEEEKVIPLTREECQELSRLYTRERNVFITYIKARNARINFEKEHGIVVSSTQLFPAVLMYISIIIIIVSTICLIIAVRRKHKIRTLMFIVLLVTGLSIMIYCAVRKSERYGICCGCKIYSIPQESAESVSEVGSGSRVRILERTENWYYIEVGETGGWCTADNIFLII